jgi:hypothetical protein
MHISKEGDPYLHAAGARGAAHSGTVRCGLRSAALGPETGRAWGEERKETSDRGDGAQAGGAAASPVGERRSIRTVAQPQPNDRGGSRLKHKDKQKSKPIQEEENQKPKPSSGDCVNRLARVHSPMSRTTGR